jgi:hypothetical protein
METVIGITRREIFAEANHQKLIDDFQGYFSGKYNIAQSTT